MSAAWVAGSVRASAISRRRVGRSGVREIATSASFGEAVERLAHSPYGQRVRPGDPLSDATRGVALTLLWNVRVLAGWLPPAGAEMMRVLAGWFELANIEEHLRFLTGQPSDPPFPLGTLATVWPRVAAAESPQDLRSALAASPWGDPGGSTARDVQLLTRLSWAERVAARVTTARPWALGAAALLVARERFARQLSLPERAAEVVARLLGPASASATALPELRAALPPDARWALHEVNVTNQLWEAELRWWRRLRADGTRLVSGSGFGPPKAVGAVALLAVDAWSVVAALEIAARGRDAWELADALA